MLRYRHYLCRAEARMFDAHPFSKANSGNRTRDHSLEGCRFTAKLYSLKSNCKESRQALLCITLCRQSSPSFSAMFPPPIRWLHTAGPVTTNYTQRGTRTLTVLNHGILRPERLPFRHPCMVSGELFELRVRRKNFL